MGSIPQSPTSSMRPRSRDTGFPDGFCGVRNTSLPHPDARIGPDACITADDISVQKVLNRQRRSFLAKNKRTISHGIITAEMERMYSPGLSLLDETTAMESTEFIDHQRSRSSKDGGDSLAPTDGSEAMDEDSSPPVSPNLSDQPSHFRKSPPVARPERRRSLLRKWMLK